MYAASELDTQREISRVVERLNQKLATDPAGIGESREPRTRVTFERPYAISYQCDPVDHVVRVGRFWTYE